MGAHLISLPGKWVSPPGEGGGQISAIRPQPVGTRLREAYRPNSGASASTPRSTASGGAAVKQSRTWVG